ncbi:31076_t:CDS:2, partial [Racocetra persica]
EIEKYVTKDNASPNITDIFKAPEIDPKSLQEPPNNKDNDLRGSDSYGNGKVSRKFYQGGIQITDVMVAKISNFKTSRRDDQATERLFNPATVNWLAPEKMPYGKNSEDLQ